MTSRCLIAAISMLGIYFGAESLKGSGMPTEVGHPQVQLEQMPMTFAHWKGENTPLDPQLFRAIGAEMVVNRRYQNGRSAVDLHSDVFTDLFFRYGVRSLHSPELCYPSSGFTVENAEQVRIETASNGVHPARLLTLSRDGVRLYCLYWYQVGDVTFWNTDEQRRIVHSFRGKNVWPLMIKVMLQTAANSPEEAQSQLKSLAALVYPWTREYH